MHKQTKTPNRRDVMVSGLATGLATIVANSSIPGAFAAAPFIGLAQPKFYRCKLGAFEITTISDSEAFIDGPYPIIGANTSEADVQQLMRDNRLPEKKYQPGFSPTLINTGKELILFDTGNGENGFVPRPNGGWLAKQLAPAGFAREQIDIVVLSHGHPDHIGGLLENGSPLFPNARYFIGQIDYDFWAPEGKHSGELEKLAVIFRTNTKQIADRFSFIKPGEDIVTGVRAIEAYGHTPGHLAFLIESNNQSLLLWGDCAHHQVASLARPDWHCAFDVDKAQAALTRQRIFEMAATEKFPVVGYHMPFPSMGYVERLQGSGFRWVPHSYQLNL
ncbi:MAG: MBL fold metallo-hydrolase [Hyphomicrobium sp.]|nr:MAG: MBL fold metallo-hydrolase [Hyphomicrobium sp.]